MPRWRYLIFHRPTMSPVAELPVIEREFTDLYNSPGSFSCTIDLDLDPQHGVALADLRAPNAVWAAELDGTLVWAGPILTVKPDFTARRISLAGEGWLNLLRRRRQEVDQTFAGVDQVDIASTLIDNVQSVAYYRGHMGVDTSLAYQGPTVARTVTYYAAEDNSTGELIENLAGLDDGFYFRFEPRWSAGPNSLLTIKFLTAWPASGRPTDLVLEDGRTCTVLSADEDGTRIANRVRAWGQGEGDEKPNALVTNPDLIQGSYILEDSVQLQTVSEVATLRSHGYTRLRQGAGMLVTPEVEVDVSWLGTFLVGDQVRFKIEQGLYSYSEYYRIVGYSCKDEATLQLNISPLVLFEGGNLV